jgi:hypothetical protein
MTAADEGRDSWGAVVEQTDALRTHLQRSSAERVSSAETRQAARSLVQWYFRRTRPDLESLRFDDQQLSSIDAAMQKLLALANGRSRRTAYISTLKELRTRLLQIEGDRERRFGRAAAVVPSAGTGSVSPTAIEARIVDALERLVPSAALSYRQALADLADRTRVSFRGPANELREALREVLDELAPDDEVSTVRGFTLESGQTRPTQKQKARYILRSQGLAETARKTAEASVELLEELIATVTRSAYARSNLTAHVFSTRRDVLQMKMYVDSVLADLLQLHE